MYIVYTVLHGYVDVYKIHLDCKYMPKSHFYTLLAAAQRRRRNRRRRRRRI